MSTPNFTSQHNLKSSIRKMRCIPIYRVLVVIGLLACVVYSNPIGRVPSVRVPSVRVPHAVVPPSGPGVKTPNYSPKETEEKKKACGCGHKRWEGCLDHNNHGRRSLDVPENYGHHQHLRDGASPKAKVYIEKDEIKPEENNKKGKDYLLVRTALEYFARMNRFGPVGIPHKKGSFPRGLYPKGQEYVTPHHDKLTYDEQQALHAVNVTIEQNGKDPVAINIIVRNNSKMNVTIMARNSVIDKDSFRLGYFHVSPDDTKINFAPQREEEEWYHTPRGKYTKPWEHKHNKHYLVNDLVHLKAGETVQQTIPIPSGTKEEQEQWFKMIRHGKKIKVYVEGKWFGIGAWKGERPHWSQDLDYGFKSNTIEMQLPPA
ncbi:hypothetical protein FIE12Z_11899 [Fusarium flagelliforme]|uniref:Uncharacterized protein n=1 Tax=Fusarium flagelliforme TaxID=2675880 RepID=A0A395M7L3_9HYPO|nr:hypothetical protein FIE12Z_11899 [Fusarium flagelliforme]